MDNALLNNILLYKRVNENTVLGAKATKTSSVDWSTGVVSSIYHDHEILARHAITAPFLS